MYGSEKYDDDLNEVLTSGSAYEISDVDEEFTKLRDLPLKSKIFTKSNNFSQLDEFLESRSNTPMPKKVRFDKEKDANKQDLTLDTDNNTLLSNDFERIDKSNYSTVEKSKIEQETSREISNFVELPIHTKSRESATESIASSNTTRNKHHVEDIIEYASQVNNYLEQNLENIDSFRADIMKSGGIYKPFSNLATENSSVWDSTSNFELSADELDENDKSNSFLFMNNFDRSSTSLPSGLLSSNLSLKLMSRTNNESGFKISSSASLTDFFEENRINNSNNNSNDNLKEYNIHKSDNNKIDIKSNEDNQDNHDDNLNLNFVDSNIYTLENSPTIMGGSQCNNIPEDMILGDSEICEMNVPNFKFLKIGDNSFNEEATSNNYFEDKLLVDYESIFKIRPIDDQNNMDIVPKTSEDSKTSVEEQKCPTINMLTDIIDILLKLTKNNNELHFISPEASKTEVYEQSKEKYDVFKMKSTPTVTYQNFIERIQSKCLFDETIYLGTIVLLQSLFLVREKETNLIKLKYPLEESYVHRLLIASIRVSSKVLQDFVHSHEYISKVFGVSKRLLTKLEVSLLLCIKNEGLMISAERLLASDKISCELKKLIENQ
ncbi:hypothetical protein TPHA_0E02750 [Tetrapisispora phaffii CBS 4417]|uniref:Uncharacterized protein n=1 Tax=Tetrapisispora phaffii (strain ATCC 24235 / CBS 4417 / NBRC 1672 / NRRL Y-8282 / UCD 70-5) TaxID=1071381 RepID=G8BTY7_TETPH|nr:hypothetical protein TPHA_0E02750 [Tetrapisispora phaffii CBS 4417]CCE63365.1 hypothetical protein TPHA_0E02750 [Tetrapisispora phaffii CBS 4417]